MGTRGIHPVIDISTSKEWTWMSQEMLTGQVDGLMFEFDITTTSNMSETEKAYNLLQIVV